MSDPPDDFWWGVCIVLAFFIGYVYGRARKPPDR